MIGMVAAAILAVVPGDSILRERVDLIEFNAVYHVTDIEGEPPRLCHDLSQIIFWRCQQTDKQPGLRACDFCLFQTTITKSGEIVPDFPRVIRNRGRCVITWCDKGTWREVSAPACLWTFTTYDPETADRVILPQDQRNTLRRPRWKAKKSSSPVERNPNWMR